MYAYAFRISSSRTTTRQELIMNTTTTVTKLATAAEVSQGDHLVLGTKVVHHAGTIDMDGQATTWCSAPIASAAAKGKLFRTDAPVTCKTCLA